MNILETQNYTDICSILGIDPAVTPDVSVYHDRDKEAAISNFRLWNANRAAWESIGEEIDFNNRNQKKYEVYAWLHDDAGSGSGFSYYVFSCGYVGSGVGARLCWPSLEIGKHMTKILTQDWINVFKLPKKSK